jgi:hypothetical protein
VSIQDIRQDPQDTSNFYLANIYQATVDSNRSSSLPASPPPFSPPTYAVWVNSLWFLSLVISITCALLATLLQQWARRYLKVTQTRSSLHKRARIRSFFAEGVKKSHLSMVVETLPALIHLSVSLFFAGLVVFLWNVNLTTFKVVLSWISICTTLYGSITLVPLFRHDSPYHSPLTDLAWPVICVIVVAFMLLYFCFYAFVICFSLCFQCRRSIIKFNHLISWVLEVMNKVGVAPEKAALKSSPEIDTRTLMWTFDSLDEDHELDRFFSGMPGFHNSRVLKHPLHGLDDQQKLRLLEAVIRLLDRTFSSNLLPDQVKRRRADTCNNAIKLLDTPYAYPNIVRRLASEDGYGPVQSSKIVDFVRRWGDRKGKYTTLDQPMFSIVVARVQQRDDLWFVLASHQLGISETDLRSHAAHGDNLSFAVLIHVTRQQFSHIQDSSWPSDTISNVLEAASKFDAQDTSPELQHEFCVLWNQIVGNAQKDRDRKISQCILRPIRHVYIRLHQGINSAPTGFHTSTSDGNILLNNPAFYPVCNLPVHVHGAPLITVHGPAPHDDAALFPVPRTSLDTPSLPVPAPLHVNNHITAMPPLHNSHRTRRTAESFPVPLTSPDQAADASVIPVSKKQKSKRQKRVIVTTAPQSAPETSASGYPPSAPVQPVAVFLQPNAGTLTPSVRPTLPRSAPAPVFDNTITTGRLLSFLLPA